MISIQEFTFGYRRQPLFSGLELFLAAGHIYGLMGKNGVGKTTLLKLISGLRFGQSGHCRVLDHNSADRCCPMLQDLFYLPEEFILPPMDAHRYADMFGRFYPQFDPQRFNRYLADFELAAELKLSELSFGQKKKFLLAFGLATCCRIMLLDEPTNGLDIPSKGQLRRVLAAELSPERAMVIATHQARDLENIIDAVVVLDAGEIVFNQSMAEVADRLSVHLLAHQPDPQSVLHTEKVPGGYAVVTANTEGEETEIDLEILFNTIVSQPETVASIFATEVQDAS